MCGRNSLGAQPRIGVPPRRQSLSGLSSSALVLNSPSHGVSACLKVNGDSDANQCSYGETSRTAIRGGPWIATVADFPQSSIYVSISHISCCACCHLLMRSQAYSKNCSCCLPCSYHTILHQATSSWLLSRADMKACHPCTVYDVRHAII